MMLKHKRTHFTSTHTITTVVELKYVYLQFHVFLILPLTLHTTHPPNMYTIHPHQWWDGEEVLWQSPQSPLLLMDLQLKEEVQTYTGEVHVASRGPVSQLVTVNVKLCTWSTVWQFVGACLENRTHQEVVVVQYVPLLSLCSALTHWIIGKLEEEGWILS